MGIQMTQCKSSDAEELNDKLFFEHFYEQHKIEMNGQSALFIQKNGLRIVLQKSDSQAIVDFFAEALDENEFFRIAMFLSEM